MVPWNNALVMRCAGNDAAKILGLRVQSSARMHVEDFDHKSKCSGRSTEVMKFNPQGAKLFNLFFYPHPKYFKNQIFFPSLSVKMPRLCLKLCLCRQDYCFVLSNHSFRTVWTFILADAERILSRYEGTTGGNSRRHLHTIVPCSWS